MGEGGCLPIEMSGAKLIKERMTLKVCVFVKSRRLSNIRFMASPNAKPGPPRCRRCRLERRWVT